MSILSEKNTGARLRLLAIILALIVPLAIFQTLGIFQVRSTRIKITQQHAYELAKTGAARYQDTIDDVRSTLGLLSRVSEVTEHSADGCALFLNDITNTHEWARSISLVGSDQRIICSVNPRAVGFDLSERPWFRSALKAGDFSVSDFFISQVNGAPSTFATLFFRDRQSQERKALIANLDLTSFDRLAASIGTKQDALVMLVDGDGVVLSRYPAAPVAGYAHVSSKLLGQINATNDGLFAGTDPDGKERLFGSIPLTSANARVVVGFDRLAAIGRIDRYILIAASVFGGVMLTAALIVWFIGDRIFVRPMENLYRLLRTTLDTMDQGLIAIDKQGRAAVINARALELLSLPPEFAASKPHKNEILEYQQSKGEFATAGQLDEVKAGIDQRKQGIYERERPNGSILEIRTVPTSDGGLVRTYSDITARRAADAAIRLEKDKAEAAARAASEFLANMSHELRTPLTAIIGVSEMLLKEPLSVEKQRHFMEMQRTAGEGLLEVINDILDYSKIDAGELDLEMAPFSISAMIEHCVKIVTHQARRKNIEVVAALGDDVRGWVLGDSTRLRQVLLNLLSNAVKFTDKGSVKLAVERVSGADRLRFSVTDTGIGILPDQLPLLFDRFSQADSSTTRRFGGTGLGLAISKRLVSLMGGSIDVQSASGQGSTFSFAIDLEPCSEPEAAPKQTFQSNTRYRLLLAEDNAVNREIITAVLEKAGHQVVTVENGEQAVRQALNNQFDAILMDVQMPEMDGYTATRAIRNAAKSKPLLPIIALTANALPDEAERCFQAGMDELVTKPVNWELLYSTIDRLVAVSRVEQSSISPEAEPAFRSGGAVLSDG